MVILNIEGSSLFGGVVILNFPFIAIYIWVKLRSDFVCWFHLFPCGFG